MEKLPENVEAYLVDSTYNGQDKVVRLIFYEPVSQKLYYYDDTTGHKPHCFTNLSPIELEQIEAMMKHNSFDHFEVVAKYDALHDKHIYVTKIVMKDPLSVGGRRKSVREILPSKNENAKVWEANIHYDSCYIYDKRIEIGMPYKVHNGELIEYISPNVEARSSQISDKIGTKDSRWVRLFEYPVPDFLRVALDIEVLGESKTRVPDSQKAEYPVISACLIGSDGKRYVYLLLRKGVEIGEEKLPEDTSLKFFDEEADLIKSIYKSLKRYPIVLTFNGDNFDLTYLYNRGLNLGLTKEETPIKLGYRRANIKGGIHIDLYRLFFNKSLRNYAFQAKYKNTKLDEIATALLGKGKLHEDVWLATEMPKWSYTELAKYNCRDGDITLELTTYDDDLVIKLILVLMRISNMVMEDIVRFPISMWIRGMLFNEHRRRNYLIPTRDDIISSPLKGKTVTKAGIKGKKYKGAIVVKPVAGVHFNVKVMDFASLYPSILKVKNLGYSTINCPHPECKSNKVPETSHWICTKNKALTGELIGILRDLRVFWYKKKRKGNPWYSVVEQAIKVYLNASYGVFGNETFDLYCPPVSESITAIGRHSISETIKKAQELGIEIIYGDTDSVFLKDPSKAQVKKLIEWSIKNLDLDLGVDKEYRYVCLSSRKKNYMGVTPDGTVDVKGMTGKKKHVPIIIKNSFDVAKKYFSEAKSEEEIEGLKKALRKVVKHIYLRIKCRDFELSEVAFHYTLGKNPDAYDKSTPQHVKAAKMLEKKGIYLKKGDIVSFIKCSGEPNVKPLQLATKKDVDINKYHEMLQSMFEQLLDPLDIDFGNIIGVKPLESFKGYGGNI